MILLYLIPKNWLSRLLGWAVNRRWPFALHRRIRDAFIRAYALDLDEAEKPLAEYETLGKLFMRRLRPGARPLGAAALVSPVDGRLTQRSRLRDVSGPQLRQIKDRNYSLSGLVGKGWDVSPYAGGAFLTLYLAPFNYHRIHAPVSGRIARVRHIAGTLWPVNDWSVANIPELFLRNDRMAVEMESEGGRVLLVLVGATNVGRITLSFCPGLIGNAGSGIRDWEPPAGLRLEKGDELGCFEMGSTVVLVLDPVWAGRLRPEMAEGGPMPVRMGMELARG